MKRTIRLFGIVLCLCVALSLMAFAVSAEETKTGYGVTINGTETLYSDYQSAIDAASAAESATLTLYQDTANDDNFIYQSGNVTLDMNGYRVNRRLCVEGCNLTVIDSSAGKGTLLEYAGCSVDYSSGKLTIDASVDCTGEGEGHEAWKIVSWADFTATIGTTGAENVVLPEGLVAVYAYNRHTETTVLDDVVIPHRHSWTEGGCAVDGTCSGCDTVIPAPGHSYDATTGNCSTCGAAVAEAAAGNGTTFEYYLTLADAVAAAETDSGITYIKLNKDVTVSRWLDMSAGTFTVDLNGYTITIDDVNNGRLYVNGAKVTFVDSSDAKSGAVIMTANDTNGAGRAIFSVQSGELTLSGGSYSYTHSVYVGMEIWGGIVTIENGVSFSGYAGSNYMLNNRGGTLIIEGGSFVGGLCAVGNISGTTIIKDGTFTGARWADIGYVGGTIDLSAMGANAADITIRSSANAAVEDAFTLGDGQTIVDYSGAPVTSIDSSMYNYSVVGAAKVSFNANGGTGSMDAVKVPSGRYYILPECTMTAPEGKLFLGWATEPNGSYTSANQYVQVTADVTYYAIWGTVVKISFDANGGSGFMAHIEGVGDVRIPQCSFTAPLGKRFIGWSDSPGGDVRWSSGQWIEASEDVTLYAVWVTDSVYVGGVQLPGGMYLAVDGTEPTDTRPEGGYAYYENGVLTLNNYTYKGAGYAFNSGTCSGIFAVNKLTIQLIGKNSLEMIAELKAAGICTDKDLTICGNGSLSIISSYDGIRVSANDDAKVIFGGSAKVTIDCGNNEGVNIQGYDVELEIKDHFQLTIGTEDKPIEEEGIYVYGEYTSFVTITDNAKVSIVTLDEEAIYVSYFEDESSVTISGNPTVNLIANKEALDAYDIYIYGGTVNVEAGEGYNAIFAEDDVEIYGGSITAKGNESGIYAVDDFYIFGGYVKAEGYYYGLYAYDCLEIYGVGAEVIAICDDEYGYDAICSNGGCLYIDDDIEILIPEGGGNDDYRIYDADDEWVSRVHLKYDGAHIYVGGVGMEIGDYLDEDGNISDTKPEEGGYAYYTYSATTGGVLTMHNFDYEGEGYIEDWDYSCVIATDLHNLTVVVEGKNELYAEYDGLYVNGDVVFIGSGYLWVEAYDYGFYIEGDMTVNGACVGTWADNPLYDCEDLTVKNGGYLELNGDGNEIYINNLILDHGSLTIDDAYLIVQDYDAYEDEYIPGTITLNGVVLEDPENGYIDEGENEWGEPCLTVFDEDGDYAYYIEFYNRGWSNYWDGWYYYFEDIDDWADGLVRLPYPPVSIDGITYGPNQDAMDYCESKGETFIDAEEGWFYFENYYFAGDYTGINHELGVYIENGFLPWHPGFVEEDGDYYYFTGDEENGGNKLATGDVCVTKNNTDRKFVIGGMYTFDEDGLLCEYDGIIETDDGTLRYYDDAQFMMGAGLVKLNEGYIYVRTNGNLAVDCKYWISNNNGLDIPIGEYTFDENGYLVIDNDSVKNGVYFENGAWYYYDNGKIGYNKGVINVSTTWYGEDGSENVYSGYIYVRSSGKLATGKYYITNVENDHSGQFITGQKVIFDDNGLAEAPKHGIVDVNGTLYFYEHNAIKYNAGLIEYNGGWIYVRSNGKVATGAYWITNTNGKMEQGKYEFGADGYMVITDTEDGIVNENGVLYYYLNGQKQYGLGLVQLDENSYIYVRTNGQLAVGKYWTTNHNDLLPEGFYEFGEDGKLTIN